MKMTITETYKNILVILNMELKHLSNLYENNEINATTFAELYSVRIHEYMDWISNTAMASDDKIDKKKAFIINSILQRYSKKFSNRSKKDFFK